MPNNLEELLEANLKHYDAGEYGDDHSDMIAITKAQIVEAIQNIIDQPIEYVKVGKMCPACNAPHMYQCTCDSGSEYTVNKQRERLREFLESSNDQK